MMLQCAAICNGELKHPAGQVSHVGRGVSAAVLIKQIAAVENDG